MDFRQLKAFAKVYEQKSFSRAAEELYLTQPTISAHIAVLEKQLKTLVFARVGKKVTPTPAGEILYARCQNIFESMKQAEEEIRLVSEEIAGTVILGGSTIPANFFLPDLIFRFLQKHPRTCFSLREGDSSKVIQRVLAGQLSLGVVGAEEEHPELNYIHLFEDALVVLASSEHFPGLTHPLSLEEVYGMSWVMRQPGSGTRRAMELAFEKAGRDHRRLRAAGVVDSTESLLRFVRNGLGVTVSSRLAARESLQRGELVILDVPELHFQRGFYMVSHRQRHHFPATRHFMEFLLEQAPSLGA